MVIVLLPLSMALSAQNLQGAEAMDWAKSNVDRLVGHYLSVSGNKLDPDEMRKELSEIGYDGSNVVFYRDAERYLVAEAYDRMLKKAYKDNKRSVIILTGPGASGKSTATKTLDYSNEGLLYDGAFNSYSSLKSAVDRAYAAGMTKVSVIAVYNDILSCFKNSVERGKQSGRYLGVGYLSNAYKRNAGKLAKLHNEYPEIDITGIDNSHNNGGRRVDLDQILKWDFSIDNETMNRILVFLIHKIDEGDISPYYYRTVGGDTADLEDLDDFGQSLADELARRVKNAQTETTVKQPK